MPCEARKGSALTKAENCGTTSLYISTNAAATKAMKTKATTKTSEMTTAMNDMKPEAANEMVTKDLN